MRTWRRHRRGWGSLALLAMLALALLPTLSHLRAGSSGLDAMGQPICTAPSGGWLADTMDGAAMPQDASAPHCPLCWLTQESPALPVAAAPAHIAAASRSEAPAAFRFAPRTLHAWRSAQPRGPPLPS